MKSAEPLRRPGRPLSFDRDAALEKAMLVFWQHGYETSSVSDLTAAMGITTPSLYTAFGDKKQLFLEAARLYAGDPEAMRAALSSAPSAYAAARDLMRAAVLTYTGDGTPRGCLLASATASGSAASADVQRFVADLRRDIQALLRSRIDRDIREQVLPPETDAASLSGMVMAVTQGLSVLARDGSDRASLLPMVDMALRAWPSTPEGDASGPPTKPG